MKRLIHTRVSVAAVLAAILIGSSGMAAFPPQRDPRSGQLRNDLTVTLKLIQVYVNDKKGNPVTDLKVGDFIVEDNGRRQQITEFEVHAVAGPGREKPPAAPAPAVRLASRPATKPAEDVKLSRTFFLLFDYFRNDISGIARAKKAARHLLDTQIQSPDEVALVSFMPYRGMVIDRPLTKDRAAVREAVDKLKYIPYLNDPIKSWPSGEPPEGAKHTRPGMTIEFCDAMKEFAKYLRSVPGIKNIVLYSRGIPRNILTDLVFPASDENADPSETMEAAEWGGSLQTGGHTLTPYIEMIQELSMSNSTVYAVNTQGLVSYEKENPEDRGLETLQNRGMDALLQITGRTGGHYYHNPLQYEEINRSLQAATGHYYVLGYYVPDSRNGDYHSIAVMVGRKDCEVRTEHGYYDSKPFKAYTKSERDIHLLSLARMNRSGGPVPISLGSAAFACPGTGSSQALVLAEIPTPIINNLFRPQSEVSVLVFDKDDQVVFLAQENMNFARLPDTSMYAYLVVPLAAGDYECRIVFRDLETGQGAVAASRVSVGPAENPDPANLKVYPPFLLLPGTPSAYLNIVKPETPDSVTESPSLQEIYRFISNRVSPVVDELAAGERQLLAAVLTSSKAAESEIDFRAELKTADSDEQIRLAPEMIGSERRESMFVSLFSLVLPGLKPGRYTLTWTAQDVTTGAESRAERNFRIR
jgi:VWFA-related protein